ncbi:MAG: acyl-CoA dehydrogenase family protein [Pseudomonadales bacterium]|jgi:alkylation response protein AidB-like acyl-CoA dehydrogenase|nr:acyl-CoA dehydrogenase family protein [Pseudomonadales bacterium]MDP7357991.1 acyl-CoA dehydrogenase family protein [Pseudomonadales bacterium]MDP7595363.1 acyl-CoA dehydrogenase family protein [Pseudomonadales bacterium]HJN51926.1 acyl-CoA dehydrogenase family protein [Pseudomonadales bacterium]|tara:strand:+ start:234 stop:1418 length:1185 start_codon:yes stop_codon:yes gene_type:complete
MDLRYSEEYETFRQEVREFIKTHKDQAPSGGRGAQKPGAGRKWQQLLIEHGYAARSIPKEYGGYGAEPDILKNHIIAEEFAIAKLRPGSSGDPRLVPTLLELGTEEQKKQHIPPSVRGEVSWCQGYSEPGSGSDLASLSTKAVLDGDDFVINGQKIWTSGAMQSEWMFALVRTEPDAPKHQGISYLLLRTDTPGLDIRPMKQMNGDSSFNEVFFTDARVPKDQIVGKRGDGWFVANATLKHERGNLGDPNAAESRFRSIVDLMKKEQLGGASIMEHPVYRDRLLKLQARMLSMKFNGMRIMSSSIKGEDPGLSRWIVKLQGCELNHQMAGLAVDIMGELGILYDGSAYLRDGGIWQYWYMLDLGLIIGGGTAQIQKNIIGERALGLPKEPKQEA